MEKNKKLMIVIIALLVVLLAIVVGVSVVAYNMLNSSSETTGEVIIEQNGIDFMNTSLIPLGSPMTINLLPSSDGTLHAINLSLSIAINTANKDNGDLINKITGSEAIIRDAINYVLSNKTLEQVAGNAAQDLLKEEILLRLQDEFKTNIIYAIYFADVYYM